MKNDSHFYTDYTGVGLEHQWMGDKKSPPSAGGVWQVDKLHIGFSFLNFCSSDFCQFS